MKTELEKMLAGELYVAADETLTAMRLKARQLFTAYNQLGFEGNEACHTLLKQLLGKCPDTIDIQGPFYCDYGCHIFAGENLFINFHCIILDCAAVTIGSNVAIATGVQILTAHHPTLASERIKGPELASPVTIGDNVWIGAGAIICPGVTIGAHTTIGAGSVVTRDIPANVVAAGNPCRVIRQL
ncbi:sugar O-acetyltransferase [Mucilaginibacter koreensis]